MEKNKRTPISSLGEFGLIRHLTEQFAPLNPSTSKGVGDDCAVIDYSKETDVQHPVQLVTSDILMEGIHFDLTYCPLRHLGYKAAMVNFSDVYAMNGMPRQLLVNIAMDKRFGVEDIEEIYAGIKLACQQCGVDLVGGDTSSSLTGLVISPTCLGYAEKGEEVRRDGAQENDLICVSGNLGAAYMGLQLLEREKSVWMSQRPTANQKPSSEDEKNPAGEIAPDFQPDFTGREYLLERQLKPEARRDIVELLRKEGIRPTAMIDISDGLSSELLHICTQSKKGCTIYEDHIPLDYQTAAMAEELNMNVTTCALNGGEDYELLFTVPLSDYEKVKNLSGIRIVGHITKQELGCQLQTRDGNLFELKAQGWQHE